MKRRTFWLGTALTAITLPLPAVAAPIRATLYKNPQCSCCEVKVRRARMNLAVHLPHVASWAAFFTVVACMFVPHKIVRAQPSPRRLSATTPSHAIDW
jgi:hypothetical protein